MAGPSARPTGAPRAAAVAPQISPPRRPPASSDARRIREANEREHARLAGLADATSAYLREQPQCARLRPPQLSQALTHVQAQAGRAAAKALLANLGEVYAERHGVSDVARTTCIALIEALLRTPQHSGDVMGSWELVAASAPQRAAPTDFARAALNLVVDLPASPIAHVLHVRRTLCGDGTCHERVRFRLRAPHHVGEREVVVRSALARLHGALMLAPTSLDVYVQRRSVVGPTQVGHAKAGALAPSELFVRYIDEHFCVLASEATAAAAACEVWLRMAPPRPPAPPTGQQRKPRWPPC